MSMKSAALCEPAAEAALAMTSLEFRGSLLTTTALIHSSSPPGFVASEKGLSREAKIKSANGCVVSKKDQIILLKRVYVSPARRSSRVRKNARNILPKSKVKQNHPDPVESHQGTTEDAPSNGRDAELPSDKFSGCNCITPPSYFDLDSPSPVLTTPERCTLSGLTEADFFRPDGTPRRRLTVRITETPEILKKIAELERLQSPARPENKDASPMSNLPSSKDALRDDKNASMFTPLESRMQSISQDEQFAPVQDTLFDTGDGEVHFKISKASDNEFGVYETVNCQSPLLSNSEVTDFFEVPMLCDSADEVSCISPLFVDRVSLDNSLEDATRKWGSEGALDLHAPCEMPEVLPLQETLPEDEMYVPNCPVNSGDSCCNGSAKSYPFVGDETENSTSYDAAPALGEHLSSCNKSPQVSNSLNGIEVKSVENMALQNGLTTGHVIVSLPFLKLPSSAPEVVVKLSDSPGNRENGIDPTPNHRGHNNAMYVDPSPTCASQASSELPCFPRRPAFVSKHGDVELSSSWPSPTSPRTLLHQDDNFQDFSEFDFLIKSGNIQALLGTEASGQVDVTQNKFKKHSPIAASNCEDKMQYGNTVSRPQHVQEPSAGVVDSSPIAAKNSAIKAKSNIKWNEILESDIAYQESIGETIDTGVDNQRETEMDLSVQQVSKSSQKKRKEKVASHRNSFRIAKRLSLLSLEEEVKRSQDEHSTEAKQNSSSDAAMIDQSESKEDALFERRDRSPQESSGVSKRKKRNRRRSCKLVGKEPCFSSSKSTPRDKSAQSPTTSESRDEATGLTSKEPTPVFPLKSTKEKKFQRYGNCTPTKEKSQRSKKQWRRRSARLNHVQIKNYLTTTTTDLEQSETQELHQAEHLHSKLISEESVSLKELESHSQEIFQKSPSFAEIHVQSESEPLRLEPSVSSVMTKSPVAAALNKQKDCDVVSQVNEYLHTLESKCSTSENGTEHFPVVTDASKFDSSLDIADQIPFSTDSQVHADMLQEFEQVPVKRARKGKDYSKCKRRRSTRLLKLSIANLEEELPIIDLNLDEQTSQQHGSAIPCDSTDLDSNQSGNSSPKPGCNHEGFEYQSSDENIWVCRHDDECCRSEHEQSETNLQILTGASEESHSSFSDGESSNVDVVRDASGNHSQEPSLESSLTDTYTAENANKDWLVQIEEADSNSRPRRRSSIVTYSKVKNVKLKKTKENDEDSIKELYLKRGDGRQVKPSSLETIFEDVQFGKTGSPLYTGSKKCKRSVIFPEHPWLPRKKKKKIPAVKRGRPRNKNKDPSIDKKLEALLAELTLTSPSSTCTSHGSWVSNKNFPIDCNGNTCIETGLGDKINSNSLPYTCTSDMSVSLVGKDASNSFEEAKTQIKRGCSTTEPGEVEIQPKKPKRDTPFRGPKASGRYAAWFKSHLTRNDDPAEKRCDKDISEKNTQE